MNKLKDLLDKTENRPSIATLVNTSVRNANDIPLYLQYLVRIYGRDIVETELTGDNLNKVNANYRDRVADALKKLQQNGFDIKVEDDEKTARSIYIREYKNKLEEQIIENKLKSVQLMNLNTKLLIMHVYDEKAIDQFSLIEDPTIREKPEQLVVPGIPQKPDGDNKLEEPCVNIKAYVDDIIQETSQNSDNKLQKPCVKVKAYVDDIILETSQNNDINVFNKKRSNNLDNSNSEQDQNTKNAIQTQKSQNLIVNQDSINNQTINESRTTNDKDIIATSDELNANDSSQNLRLLEITDVVPTLQYQIQFCFNGHGRKSIKRLVKVTDSSPSMNECKALYSKEDPYNLDNLPKL